MRRTTGTLRGVENEDQTRHSSADNRALRQRSLRLLGSLAKPVRGQITEVAIATVLGTAAKVAVPALVGLGVDAGFAALDSGVWTRFLVIAGLTFVCAISAGLLEGHAKATTPKFAQAIVLELRRRLFAHSQRLSISFHERYTSGRMISRQTSDIDALREFVGAGISQFVGSLLFLVGVVGALLALDLTSGLILLAALIPTGLLGWWFLSASRPRFRAVRSASAAMIGSFVESMVGIRAVQVFRAQAARVAQFRDRAKSYRKANADVIVVFGIGNTTIVLLAALTAATLMFVDGSRALAGEIPVGVLLSAVLYARQFFDPITDIMLFANQFQSATSALEKISGVLEEQPTLQDPPAPVRFEAPAHGALAVTGLEFAYDGKTPVLQDLNLEVPAGQIVALIGETGAGKSTLAKLIARIADPGHGTITLDGVDLRHLTDAELRRNLVMVTQESYLFSGSVAANIALGRPGATQEDIEAAAITVGADGFIRALPEGYDTDVRSRGGRLSAGQRQLVSFARAFLADPRVLILDEATSSLDLPSERMVQRGLQTLLQDRTSIIIAHRLSTVAIADRVLVMADGRIVEDGSPSQLIAEADGQFAALNRQWEQSMGQPF